MVFQSMMSRSHLSVFLQCIFLAIHSMAWETPWSAAAHLELPSCHAEHPEAGKYYRDLYASHSEWCSEFDESGQIVNPIWKVFRARKYWQDRLASRITEGAPISGNETALPSITAFPPAVQANPNWPMGVYVHLEVFRISQIDQKSRNFKIHFSISLSWLDCRIIHNCSTHVLHDNQPEYWKLWRPEYRFTQIDTTPTPDMRKGSMFLNPDGYITWVEERIVTATCAMDFDRLPWDEHECHMMIFDPVFGSNVLQMHSSPRVVGKKLTALEWKISQPADWKIEKSQETEGFYGLKCSSLKFSFKITRDPGHLIKQYVLPTVWIYLTSWCGLWIDGGAVPARAAMAVIPVLIMINKQSALSSSLPPLSSPTKLGSFMQASIAFVVIHMFEFAFAHWFGKLKKEQDSKKVLPETVYVSDGTDDGRPNAPTLPVKEQIKSRIMKTVHVWDTMLRIASLSLYALTVLIIFAS